MFGKKKPTIFDAAQDKQLKQLMANQKGILANQKILVDNNSYFIKQNKALWAWIKHLDPRVKNLEGRMSANERKDAEQAQLFANLSQSATKGEEE